MALLLFIIFSLYVWKNLVKKNSSLWVVWENWNVFSLYMCINLHSKYFFQRFFFVLFTHYLIVALWVSCWEKEEKNEASMFSEEIFMNFFFVVIRSSPSLRSNKLIVFMAFTLFLLFWLWNKLNSIFLRSSHYISYPLVAELSKMQLLERFSINVNSKLYSTLKRWTIFNNFSRSFDDDDENWSFSHKF